MQRNGRSVAAETQIRRGIISNGAFSSAFRSHLLGREAAYRVAINESAVLPLAYLLSRPCRSAAGVATAPGAECLDVGRSSAWSDSTPRIGVVCHSGGVRSDIGRWFARGSPVRRAARRMSVTIQTATLPTTTSVPEWDRQFRLVRAHHKHREKLGRLGLAGIGADAVAVAGQLGEALSSLVGRHRSVVNLTADRPLEHGRADDGGFGMRVARRVAAGPYSTSTPL